MNGEWCRPDADAIYHSLATQLMRRTALNSFPKSLFHRGLGRDASMFFELGVAALLELVLPKSDLG